MDHLPLSLPVYKKLIASPHTFKSECLYSFNDIACLIKASPLGVKARALSDNWPAPEIYTPEGKVNTRRLVDGGFLRQFQTLALWKGTAQ